MRITTHIYVITLLFSAEYIFSTY